MGLPMLVRRRVGEALLRGTRAPSIESSSPMEVVLGMGERSDDGLWLDHPWED